MTKIRQSQEDYLETILVLKERLGYVRSIDVATELGYSKPSISRAMGILKTENLIIIEPNGNIKLTDEGLLKAKKIYERHTVLTKYLTEHVGVSAEVASEDACRIEHVISEETFQKIKSAIE